VKDVTQIPTAVVRRKNGEMQKIYLYGVADIVHLFALALGYTDEMAFRFAVISRSVPDVEQSINLEFARKALRIADQLQLVRQGVSGADLTDGAVRAAISHISLVREAYDMLVKSDPSVIVTFQEQYDTWTKSTTPVKRKGFLARLREWWSL